MNHWSKDFVFVLTVFCFAGVFLLVSQVAVSEEPQAEAIKIIIDALRSGDPAMQAGAIALAREIPGAEATKALAKELPNLPSAGQVQLLSALADRGDRSALPAVISATKAKDTSVRIAALKALGQLGNASSVALLAQTAANGKAEEQKAARESLYRLRGVEVDKAILATLRNQKAIYPLSPKVKVELIRSIAERNIAAGVETLLKTAREPDSRVQRESFKAIKVIADEKHLPALVELLLKVKSVSVRSEAEKTIAAVAHKIKDKNHQADAVLAALPKVLDSQKRCSLLSVLGRIGDDSALAVLRATLSGDSAKEQDAAIRALSNWPNPKPINDLLTVAKTSKNEIHRILALRGFVRLIGRQSDRPAKETIKMYQQAMELSQNVREKKMILSGLANVKSLAALEMAASYLQDAALQQEAEVAIIKIAEGIYESHPRPVEGGIDPVRGFALATDVLNKLIQTSKNDSLCQKAQGILNQIKKYEEKQ